MKVLLAAYSGASSGIGTYTMEIAYLLSGYADLTVLSLDSKLNDLNSYTINQDITFRGAPLLSFLDVRDEIRHIEENYDVVHETLPPYGTESKRLITTKWSYESFIRIVLYRMLWHPFPENLGAFPVTVQHYIMDCVSKRKSLNTVYVNKKGDDFIPPPIRLRSLKKYNDLKPLKILFVSRDLSIKRKNLKVVIDALRMVHREVELHTVGNGKSSGVVHGYMGREELINLMHDMDILILPSIYEELGYVGLEAYSVGLPVVTSNIQSFQTIFTESPRFEPFNSFQLATIIDNLSPDGVEEMGRNSWNSVKKSNEIARKRLLSLYESVHSKK